MGIDMTLPKFCPSCKQTKPRDEFYKTNSKKWKHGLSGYCKECKKSQANEWARSRPKDKRALARRRYELKRFGVTPEWYDEQLKRQGGKCAICKGESGATRANLDIDHCHETLKVRGLLCSLCNKAIGMFGDSQVRVRAAVHYLHTWDAAKLMMRFYPDTKK